MVNTYDRPPPATVGSKAADLYNLVGYILSVWEHIEAQMGDLFQLLSNTHISTSSLVFGAIESSQTRHAVTRAAAKSFFLNYPCHGKRLDKLLEYVGKHSGIRNDAAHGTVVKYEGEGGSFLVPASYSTRRHSFSFGNPAFIGTHSPKWKYNADNLNEFCDIFIDLKKRLIITNMLLRRFIERHPLETLPPYQDSKYEVVGVIRNHRGKKP